MAVQDRGRRTKQQVLDAALPLFAERGIRTRVEDLSASSGVSVGSIYHHFGSREGVVNAVYAAQLANLVDCLAEATVQEESLHGGVAAFITTYIEWIIEHPQAASLIYEIGHLSADRETLSVAATSKSVGISQMTAWLRTFAEAGEVRVSDPTVVELILIGPVREYCQRYLAGIISEPPEVIGPQLIEAAWRAIRSST